MKKLFTCLIFINTLLLSFNAVAVSKLNSLPGAIATIFLDFDGHYVQSSVWNGAIENQCYVARVNRVGMDGKGIHYTGDSVVIDPRGAVIGQVEPSMEGTASVTFDREALEDFRAKFPVALEADDFELKW